MAESTGPAQVYKSPPLLKRIGFATKLSLIKAILGLVGLLKHRLVQNKYPPDLVKSYECRPKWPIRVFFPSSYSKASHTPLPTLFTIHGGGFCIGEATDDDEWNRRFADSHSILVIALNYAKAPSNPFPGPLNDVQALLHAVHADDTLPLDKSRLAVAGWSAGGSLALTLSRAETRLARDGAPHVDLKAAIPIYPVLDHATPPTTVKIARRRWKLGKLPGARGSGRDFVLPLADMFDWAYTPRGQDLRNASMSPFHGARGEFAPHLFVVASELDFLAWEAWAFARRMAGGEVTEELPGREEAGTRGELELADERFHWEEGTAGGSTRWLLVPDVMHSFDMKPAGGLVADAETKRDADAKTVRVMEEMASWLARRVWTGRESESEALK